MLDGLESSHFTGRLVEKNIPKTQTNRQMPVIVYSNVLVFDFSGLSNSCSLDLF